MFVLTLVGRTPGYSGSDLLGNGVKWQEFDALPHYTNINYDDTTGVTIFNE